MNKVLVSVFLCFSLFNAFAGPIAIESTGLDSPELSEPTNSQIIAKLDSQFGSLVFIEEIYNNESSIGMLSTGSVNIDKFTSEGATPLEIYLTFSTENVVPDKLVKNHYQQVKRKPRDLEVSENIDDQPFAKSVFGYRNLSKDTNICNDISQNFYGEYSTNAPMTVWSNNSTPPAEEFIPGGSVYDLDDAWWEFKRYLFRVQTRLAFGVYSKVLENQKGDSDMWSQWGRQRDIAVCVNSWWLDLEKYEDEGWKYEHNMNSAIPWDEYGVEPCTSGQCKHADQTFGLCYAQETEGEIMHSEIKFRVTIYGQSSNFNIWQGPTVDLKWIGEGARYYSSFNSVRRYKVKVRDLANNTGSYFCQANYLVYMRVNSNVNSYISN